ncbi:MAG: DUF4258 domain-containing protein [Paracoccaceae bacterium]
MSRVRLHPHAEERAAERGASAEEIAETVATGARAPARHGRTAFERDFPGPFPRGARRFDSKRLLVYAVEDDEGWLVVTVVVKYRSAP